MFGKHILVVVCKSSMSMFDFETIALFTNWVVLHITSEQIVVNVQSGTGARQKII